jgi:hypothetical protein
MVDRTKIRPANPSLGVRSDRRQDDGDQPTQAVREAEYPGYLGTGLIPKSCFTTDPVLGVGPRVHMLQLP